MTDLELAQLEAKAEAAEAEARALRRRIAEERAPAADLPRVKRKPKRLPPAVVPVSEIDVARARATARRMGIALPDPTGHT